MADPKSSNIAGQVLSSFSQAQIELESLRRELEESHRLALVGTMAAGLAHEINNLLTPVLAHAQLAAARPGDLQMQADTLQKVMRGVKDAASLTRTILGLAGDQTDARSEATRGASKPRVVIRDAVEAATRCMVRAPQKDGIELTNRVRPNLEARMEPILLQQVLLNLILNAQRAMTKRRGRIEIEAEEVDGEMIEISVADNGPGIPAQMIDRLFEPFARRRSSRDRGPAPMTPHGSKTGDHDTRKAAAAGAVTDRKSAAEADPFAALKQQGGATAGAGAGTAGMTESGGSGLGLATCRLLIEHAGGRIAVRSTPGRGATFTITLPRAAPAATHRAAG